MMKKSIELTTMDGEVRIIGIVRNDVEVEEAETADFGDVKTRLLKVNTDSRIYVLSIIGHDDDPERTMSLSRYDPDSDIMELVTIRQKYIREVFADAMLGKNYKVLF
ncbi:MAG: hypothetical protein NC548_27865 [Lachnospiraceae bacterium]|nr:hypothetical protein [Lachnospiraceae bacterium]